MQRGGWNLFQDRRPGSEGESFPAACGLLSHSPLIIPIYLAKVTFSKTMPTELKIGLTLEFPRKSQFPGEALDEGCDRYSVDERLGAGQFGTVYKCQQLNDPPPGEKGILALKWVSGVVDRKLFDNLTREVQVLFRIGRHDNVVSIRNSWCSAKRGSLAIILEYCGGGDLRDYLQSQGRLTEATAKRFGRQIASGMDFIWSKGCIHRDLKPANVLLSEQSDRAVLKVADFGFAKTLGDLSVATSQCGSPLYAAPEVSVGVARRPLEYSGVKADVFSLGVVCFELLTGAVPFGRGSSPSNHIERVEKGTIKVPKGMLLREDAETFVRGMLHPNPTKRWGRSQIFDTKVNPYFVSDKIVLRSQARILECARAISLVADSISARMRLALQPSEKYSLLRQVAAMYLRSLKIITEAFSDGRRENFPLVLQDAISKHYKEVLLKTSSSLSAAKLVVSSLGPTRCSDQEISKSAVRTLASAGFRGLRDGELFHLRGRDDAARRAWRAAAAIFSGLSLPPYDLPAPSSAHRKSDLELYQSAAWLAEKHSRSLLPRPVGESP